MDYVSLGCCTLAFVLYINTLSAGFVYDDRRAILGNPDVLGTGSWSQMLHNDFWGTPLVDSGSHGSYRPLCVASFKLNYLLDGFKPFGYHLVNVLLHSLATGLVVKLARHLLPAGRSGVAIAGLLFAAHPIHTEAVAGVVGRADLTGCIFYLLALLAYIRHVRWRQWGDRRQWLALAATVLLAAAALLCKETAVTALVVCAIYDIIKGYAGSRDKFICSNENRSSGHTNPMLAIFSTSPQHRTRSLGIIALSLAFIVHCRLTLPRPATLFSTADNPTARSGSLWTRFLTFTYLPVVNFKLLLLPDVLSFDWGMDAIPRLGTVCDRKVALAALFYLALGWALWSSCRALVNRQQSPVRPSGSKTTPNASSFNRKLANKLNLARLRAGEEGSSVPALPVVQLDDRENGVGGGGGGCALCKQDAGLHHTSSCRTLHNNNGLSSIMCGCGYAPEYKYLSLATPSQLASYFCRTAGSSSSSSKGTERTTTNNNDSASINYNQSFQGAVVGKKFACHWPLGTVGDGASKEKPFPFTTLLTAPADMCSPSLSSSSYTSSSSSSSSSSTTSSCASSVRGDSADGSSDEPCLPDEGSSLHNSPAAALLMSVALLALPFLPASNLLFYVGFVVAERILYLPSVGYCLLVGLGAGALIDGGGGGRSSPASCSSASGKLSSYGRGGRRNGPPARWLGTFVRKCLSALVPPGDRSVGGAVCSDGAAVRDDASGSIHRTASDNGSGVSGRYGKFQRTNGMVAPSVSVQAVSSGGSGGGGSVSAKASRPATASRGGRAGRSTKPVGPRRRQLVLVCVGLLLIAYSAKTVRRNRDWADEESLFRSAVAVNPPKGILLQNQQDYNEAVESFRKAIRFRPSLARKYFPDNM
uniref:dolichyl-phosphate-mannose--protein mannosyltransferase n=1 Tax=Anopheles melas TaxID=34690 RepID=A0A3F2YZN5_9DIPT